MLAFRKLACILTFCSIGLLADAPRVVQLVPPEISKATVSEEIVCTRPMREEKFNISSERRGGKIIINCYGHGGSGFSTLFGSVNKAISLYESTRPKKEVPIRVIGSGCMGLTTAIELQRRGYRIEGIYTRNLYDLPSWKAPGYFALPSIKTSPAEQKNLNEIGLDTFITYQKIDKGEHPYITKNVVRFMPLYCSVDTEAGLEELEVKGMIPPREYVSLDFGNEVIYHDFVKYMTYFINVSTLMRQLTGEVNRLKIDIKLKDVKSFDEISEAVVFNCAGLGGRELNADKKMVAVRGHLITFNRKAGKDHMDYMIYTKVKQNGRDAYVYLFPKDLSVTGDNPRGIRCMGVLGGTYIPNVDKLSSDKQKHLDRTEFDLMLERSSQFFLGRPFGK